LPASVKNAWHLVALARDIPVNGVRAVVVAGTPVALFRGAAGLGALIDRCPHRNYPLSLGRVVGAQIECSYHGWRFDPAGRCMQVPGCDVRTCDDPRLSAATVRVAERFGGIFVSLDSQSGAELELPPLLGDPGYDHFWWRQGIWQGRAYDAIENVLDPFHTNHLHHGYIRRRDRRLPVRLQVNSFGDGIEMVIEQTRPDLGLMSRFLEPDRTRSRTRYFPPTIVQARWEGAKKLTLCVTAFFTPSKESSFMPFACFSTPKGLAPEWLKQAAIRLFLRPVVAQDRRALASQSEVMEHFRGPRFTSGPGDILGGRIHRLWNGDTIPSGSDPPVEAML
jgi:phenylpropionate dioxygenase-like ring-hydroxylating dioxygenase large terminal subunit